jgi:hypothetical protein
MRRILGIATAAVGLALSMMAQEEATKPKISSDALTEEQVAIYRAVLEDYTNGSKGPLNVADKTQILDLSEMFIDKGCVRGLDLESSQAKVPVVHKLDGRVSANNKQIVLVDAELQERKIKENDPQRVVDRAIDGNEKVTEKQISDSVERAFRTGLFTFSEIAFARNHQRAVVAYSFVCGGLCGHGSTLVLKKVGEKWKVGKRCGGWVS